MEVSLGQTGEGLELLDLPTTWWVRLAAPGSSFPFESVQGGGGNWPSEKGWSGEGWDGLEGRRSFVTLVVTLSVAKFCVVGGRRRGTDARGKGIKWWQPLGGARQTPFLTPIAF